jgi:hypothetical protein
MKLLNRCLTCSGKLLKPHSNARVQVLKLRSNARTRFFQPRLWYSPRHEQRIKFRKFLARICSRAQPAGHASDSLIGDAGGVGTADRGHCVAALVVDRGRAYRIVRAGVGLTLFCGTQSAGHFRASAVVVVGGSKNGGADARRQNERGSRALHNQPELKNRNLKLKTTPRGPRGFFYPSRRSRRRAAGADPILARWLRAPTPRCPVDW